MASKWDNLPPGGIVIDSDGRTTIVQYVPAAEKDEPADKPQSLDEAREELRKLKESTE